VLEQAAEVGDTTVLVVDNDPAASAMPMASEFPPDRVRFVHEPTPGIVAGRNRALDESAGADVLVFIDDDELPDRGWLRAIVTTWERTGAAAVAAPVLSTFAEEPDPWVTAGGFFVRRRLPTGTDLTIAATGNLLLDVEQVRRSGLRFDLRFAQSGGSDSMFTSELHKRGYRMVWCDEAIVADVVPATRANRRWVLQRAVRSGNASSRVALILADTRWQRLRTRAVLLVRGGARIVGGSARILVGTITRALRHQARGSRTLARGIGMASGAVGYTREEYRRK
jgi:cellulose synthase/poly-beta-1,6-N-acetylglucosamine synthase-like glycosyltransferase